MADSPRQCSLLEELDARQEEVLAQLDSLNTQIEQLLEECLRSRDAELQAVES